MTVNITLTIDPGDRSCWLVMVDELRLWGFHCCIGLPLNRRFFGSAPFDPFCCRGIGLPSLVVRAPCYLPGKVVTFHSGSLSEQFQLLVSQLCVGCLTNKMGICQLVSDNQEHITGNYWAVVNHICATLVRRQKVPQPVPMSCDSKGFIINAQHWSWSVSSLGARAVKSFLGGTQWP